MHDALSYLLLGAGGYALLIVTLMVLASAVPATAYYTRMVLSFALLSACALYGVVASIFLRIAGYGGLSQWTTARGFKWTMGLATGVWFTISGEENLVTRPAVFIGNHQTELDVLMLGAIFPKYCSVTAKKQLKWWPFLGWFMALSKTVFIDRGNRALAKSAFDGAARTIQHDRQSVFIFPEGTRSYTDQPEMLPFKKGAFHLAVQAQVPIVPVVVANYSNVLSIKARRFVSGTIPIKVLPPISTKGLTPADVNDLVETTRTKMLDELVKLTAAARQDSAASSEKQNGVHSTAIKASGVERVR